jgi:hypothetical protein
MLMQAADEPMTEEADGIEAETLVANEAPTPTEAQKPQFYRGPGDARLLVESAWYHAGRSVIDEVQANPVWAALAHQPADQPFLPTIGLERLTSRSELLLALALIDLPLAAKEHQLETVATGRRFTAGSPTLLAVERLAELPVAEGRVGVHRRVMERDAWQQMQDLAPTLSGNCSTSSTSDPRRSKARSCTRSPWAPWPSADRSPPPPSRSRSRLTAPPPSPPRSTCPMPANTPRLRYGWPMA